MICLFAFARVQMGSDGFSFLNGVPGSCVALPEAAKRPEVVIGRMSLGFTRCPRVQAN